MSTLRVNAINNQDGGTKFYDGSPSFDLWRLTANFTTNDTTITGWERPDTPTGIITNLNGLSETSTNSGIFTFPSTGIYHITIHFNGVQSSGSDTSMGGSIMISTDSGSNFTRCALSYAAGDTDSGNNNGASATAFFNVTDTSTFQLSFKSESLSSGSFLGGNTGYNYTTFTSIKLAPIQ